MIKEFILGADWRTDNELFGMVGSRILDVNVHNRLGAAVTSKPGDVWYVTLTEKKDVRGFAVLRIMKSTKALHIRFIYSDLEKDKMLRQNLIRKALGYAEREGLKMAWTNDRDTEHQWAELGFVAQLKTRGSFVRWEKTLEQKA